MVNTLLIRDAGFDEAEILGQIIRESFRGQAALLGFAQANAAWFVEFTTDDALREDLEKGHLAFLLCAADEPAGTVWIRPVSTDPEMRHLGKLAVLPAFRGRGYGEQLCAHAEERLKELGVQRARLACIAEFTRLCAFYRRLGYEVAKRNAFPTLPFEVLMMEKDLRV